MRDLTTLMKMETGLCGKPNSSVANRYVVPLPFKSAHIRYQGGHGILGCKTDIMTRRSLRRVLREQIEASVLQVF